MRYAFLVYPAGVAGAGLVMLRIAVMLSLATALTNPPPPPLVFCTIVVVAMAVGSGLFTRFFAAAACLLIVGLVLELREPAAMLGGALTAAALAMLGPGALSIDGLRFGRRTVRLPSDTNTKV